MAPLLIIFSMIQLLVHDIIIITKDDYEMITKKAEETFQAHQSTIIAPR